MTSADCASPVHVFFGTQTGNAEEIARRIASELPQATGPATCLSAAGKSPAFALNGPPSTVVMVVATTGDGDPPDKIRPFMRFLRGAAKEKGSLAGVRYALLGLGDTNYESFCGAAKKVDIALGRAGATPFVKRGLADDGTGLEGVVEPWLAALPAAVEEVLAEIGAGGGGDVKAKLPEKEESEKFEKAGHSLEAVVAAEVVETSAKLLAPDLPKPLAPTLEMEICTDDLEPVLSTSPYFDEVSTIVSRVVGAELLTSSDAVKPVYHVELDCGDGLEYMPGDAFGVIVENMSEEVERCVAIIAESDRADDDSVVRTLRGANGGAVLAHGTARTLLSQRVDIRAMPKKTLLRSLAEHCSNAEDEGKLLDLAAKKARPAPALDYSKTVLSGAMSTLDVLEQHAPSCRPPLALLLDQLPPLALRYYSAASAPEVDGSRIHFAFSLVTGGLATPMLAAIADKLIAGASPDSFSPVLVVPRAPDVNAAFRPPKDLTVPYIMVGPGTGVAPFRGFLRQRAALVEEQGSTSLPGETMLFFGCRNEANDFLYGKELRELEGSAALSKLDVAFSRDGPAKVYVQDLMEQRGEEVAAAIEGGASIFVCGDGGGMAVGVDRALHSLVAAHICDGNAAEAKIYIKRLANEKRYVRDIWYFGVIEE